MMEFEVGDRVRVRKPEDVMEGYGWLPEMDCYDNQIGKISWVCDSDYSLDISGIWIFDPAWLTLVEEDPLSWVVEGL